jgi:hypothetical protein
VIRRRLLIGCRVVTAVAAGAIVPGPAEAAGSSSGSLSPTVLTTYVYAQARALCLVQTKAFPTLAAQHAAYVEAEHSGHLTSHQLALARAAVAQDMALRTRISNRVAATCGKHR